MWQKFQSDVQILGRLSRMRTMLTGESQALSGLDPGGDANL
jgi:hypothetical protein